MPMIQRFFFSADDIPSLISTANLWLQNLSNWLYANQLKLNTNKTKYILFSSINKPVYFNDNVTFRTQVVERVPEHKFLGVQFHENLKWTSHVNNVRHKIAYSIGLLNKLRLLLPEHLRRQLYFNTIQSRIDYCLLVWGNSSKYNIDSLHIMQKKGIRFISNLARYEHTSPYFRQLRILPIHYLYKLRLSEIVFSEIKSDRDLFFSMYVDAECRYNFRHNSFKTPRTRTKYGEQILSWQIPNLLNQHPNVIDVIDKSPSMRVLRKQLNLMFLQYI